MELLNEKIQRSLHTRQYLLGSWRRKKVRNTSKVRSVRN
jgi:hypothetical protein